MVPHVGAHGALPCYALISVPPNDNAKVLTPKPLNVRAPGGGVSEGVIGGTLPYVTVVLIWGGNQDTDLHRGLTMSGNRYNGISYAGREAAEDAALPALAFGLAAPRAVATAA